LNLNFNHQTQKSLQFQQRFAKASLPKFKSINISQTQKKQRNKLTDTSSVSSLPQMQMISHKAANKNSTTGHIKSIFKLSKKTINQSGQPDPNQIKILKKRRKSRSNPSTFHSRSPMK
jgi:hypothetical protein